MHQKLMSMYLRFIRVYIYYTYIQNIYKNISMCYTRASVPKAHPERSAADDPFGKLCEQQRDTRWKKKRDEIKDMCYIEMKVKMRERKKK